MANEFWDVLSDLLLSRSSQAADRDNELELERHADYEAGMAAMRAGKFEDAIPLLKKATDSIRLRKDAHYALGQCYEQLNMLPLARKTYERLLRLDYNFEDVRERLNALDRGKPLRAEAAPPPADAATVIAPAQDRYELLATIHESASARIYRVRDRVLGRILALKQVKQSLAEHQAHVQQLKDRAKLEHPNILRVYDIDEKEGRIAMEYVEGGTLRDALRNGTLPKPLAMRTAVQIINGLHYAHQRQIIHHALTPEHVLLDRQGNVKLTGFRALNSFMRLQKTDPPEKYFYLPPELFRNGRLSIAANIYSFGVMLHEMLTGQPPFSLQQIQAFARQHAPLLFDEHSAPSGAGGMLRRCLSPSPEERHHTIRALGEELIVWFRGCEAQEGHQEAVAAYKDALMIAMADGKISKAEAALLAQKRQELHVTDAEARLAAAEARDELRALLHEHDAQR